MKQADRLATGRHGMSYSKNLYYWVYHDNDGYDMLWIYDVHTLREIDKQMKHMKYIDFQLKKIPYQYLYRYNILYI